jgi:hypothetical protein
MAQEPVLHSFNPIGATIDATNSIYVADTLNGVLRKVTTTGIVTTFAGSGNLASIDGTGTTASRFANPASVVWHTSGFLLWPKTTSRCLSVYLLPICKQDSQGHGCYRRGDNGSGQLNWRVIPVFRRCRYERNI